MHDRVETKHRGCLLSLEEKRGKRRERKEKTRERREERGFGEREEKAGNFKGIQIGYTTQVKLQRLDEQLRT